MGVRAITMSVWRVLQDISCAGDCSVGCMGGVVSAKAGISSGNPITFMGWV
jgi:hypothetical protein